MTANATELKAVDAILKSFQRGLQASARAGWLARRFFGQGPTVGYAEQFAGTDTTGHFTGSAVAVWRITTTEIEELPASVEIPRPGFRRGMYFDSARFSFTLPDDSGTGVIGSLEGPRSGCGYRYRLVESERGLQIHAEQSLRIS